MKIWRPWRGLAICGIAVALSPLNAQQTAPATPAPALPEPQPSPPQAPTPPQSQGEQVHTGVTSGLDTEARLESLLADHQFPRIESQLDEMPPQQARLYRGILANRNNDAKSSIELLAPLLDQTAANENPAQEKLLRKALAEDYLRIGDMAKAAAAYQALAARAHLTTDEQDEIELPLKLAPLAAANPPMTVEPYEPFSLQITRNPLGLTELPIYIDARPHSWMLDPTTPFNLISRSEAKEAGLKVSEEFAIIHTLTGRPIPVRMTVIPRFTIGGRITFRNITAFVFDDADFAFPKSHYQVEGELGYAALSALGSITITADSTVEVRPIKPALPTEKDDPPTPGVRFYLDGEQMIVGLGIKGQGSIQDQIQERMFVVDASGQQTYLTSRYYDEHADNFANQKMELFSIPGAQSRPSQPAFMAESIPLAIGPTDVDAHYIQVLTQPLGQAALDDVYGVLGMDFLDQLKSYTFDYRTMRFAVRTE